MTARILEKKTEELLIVLEPYSKVHSGYKWFAFYEAKAWVKRKH